MPQKRAHGGRRDGVAPLPVSPCGAPYSSSAAAAAAAAAAVAAAVVPRAADSSGETPPMDVSPEEACAGESAAPLVPGSAWVSVKLWFWEAVVLLRRFVALVPFS